VVWSYHGFPGLPFIGNFNKKPSVRQFFESLRLTIKPLDFKWNEFIIDGDSAVVLGSAKIQVQSTGKIFEHNWCHIYTLKEGKIATLRGFTSNPYGMAIAFNAL
jgi:ketosteroid isomerase-like protein